MEIKYSKTTLVLILLSMRAFADSDSDAKTVYYTNEKDGLGNYAYSFETSNGISRQESGTVENAGQPDAYLRVAGSYSYPAPDGKIVQVRYEADEKGFKILPVTFAPPLAAAVSPQIVASLLGRK